jgi:hypothetical protein
MFKRQALVPRLEHLEHQDVQDVQAPSIGAKA